MKELEREVRELRRANEILRKASAFFAQAGTRPPTEVMVAFIDTARELYGVEPMCAVLPIAPATYFRHKRWQADPDQRSRRAQRDAWLTTQIQRVCNVIPTSKPSMRS